MNFLVEHYEIRGGSLCIEMSYVSASKSGTPKACGTLTTLGNSRVKMGFGLHGFCSRLTTHPEEEQHNSSYCGLTHEDGSLHSHEKHMDIRSVGTSLPGGDSSIAWCTELYSLRRDTRFQLEF